MGQLGKALVVVAQQFIVAPVVVAVGIRLGGSRHGGELAAGRVEALHHPLVDPLGHAFGNVETGVARIHQKAGDIRGEPIFIRTAVAIPEPKASVGTLHARNAANGPFDELGTLRPCMRLQPNGYGRRFVNEDMGVGGAGGLLQAAVGVVQQTLHDAVHIEWRAVGQGDAERG